MDVSSNLYVDDLLHTFVEKELLPGTGVEAAAFWRALEAVLAEFTPKNAALLVRRDELQAKIDAWWRERRGKDVPVAEQEAFLREIGYLLPEGPSFSVSTENVDAEIARVAGPQLVVPVMNARYALNA
ncbi:MAG: malate synthase G, partial [Phenylobacterium sp.]